MKLKTIGFFILLLNGVGHILQAQDSIVFEVGLRPQMVYQTNTQMIAENVLRYQGDSLMLENLKQAGIENPQVSVDTTTSSSLTYTGSAAGDTYPLQMKILQSSNYDLPAGTMLFGEVKAGRPVFDSIANLNMEPASGLAVLKAVSAMIENTQVPPTTLQVGETFSHSVPMEIPIGSSVFVLDIVTAYTLIDITDGIANLDLDQVIVMNTIMDGIQMDAKGTGTGTATYSTNPRFLTGMNLELDMTLEMEIQGIQMILEMNSVNNQDLELLNATDFPGGLINKEN